MHVRKPRYSHEEFARRGNEIFNRVVVPTLLPEHNNWFVAIDIETESFDIDRSDVNAVHRMIERSPDCQLWLEQVGHRAARRMGGSSLRRPRQ